MAGKSQQPKQDKVKSNEFGFRDVPHSNSITEHVNKESDRSTILITAAYLEELLGALISHACVSNSVADLLLALRAPAGDFESRLLITQAFGLLNEQEIRALRIVQKMRNKAAHFDRTGRGFNVLFDSAPTMDQVVELCTQLKMDRPIRIPEIIRLFFIAATSALATTLLIRRELIARPKAAESIQELATVILKHTENTLIGKKLDSIIKSRDKSLNSYNNILVIYKTVLAPLIASGLSEEEVMRTFEASEFYKNMQLSTQDSH